MLWSRGEGQALLGGAGGGEAGLKAQSPHKAGFWKMAHPAGFEPTTPAFGVLKVTLYDCDVSAKQLEKQRFALSVGSFLSLRLAHGVWQFCGMSLLLHEPLQILKTGVRYSYHM